MENSTKPSNGRSSTLMGTKTMENIIVRIFLVLPFLFLGFLGNQTESNGVQKERGSTNK